MPSTCDNEAEIQVSISKCCKKIICDCEKTRNMGFFVKAEFYVWLISSTIELTRVQVSDRLRFVKIQRFVCDCATPPIIEKLQSKGVAMHAYGVSAYYA